MLLYEDIPLQTEQCPDLPQDCPEMPEISHTETLWEIILHFPSLQVDNWSTFKVVIQEVSSRTEPHFLTVVPSSQMYPLLANATVTRFPHSLTNIISAPGRGLVHGTNQSPDFCTFSTGLHLSHSVCFLCSLWSPLLHLCSCWSAGVNGWGNWTPHP